MLLVNGIFPAAAVKRIVSALPPIGKQVEESEFSSVDVYARHSITVIFLFVYYFE